MASNLLLLHPTLSSTSLPSGLQGVQDQMSLSRYALRLANGIPGAIEAVRGGGWKWGDLEIEKYFDDDDEEKGVYPIVDRAPRAVDVVEDTMPIR